MIRLAENLRRLRRETGIRQEQLAIVLGVTPQAVSKWERDESYPDITLLPAIANYFSVTLDELMGVLPNSRADRVNELLEKTQNLSMTERFPLLLEAYRQYPSDPDIAHELIDCISWEDSLLAEFLMADCPPENPWLSRYAYACIEAARGLFALGEKEEGYACLEKGLDAYEKWDAIPDRTPLVVGNAQLFGDIRIQKDDVMVRLLFPDVTREHSKYAGLMDFRSASLNFLLNHCMFNSVRDEERFLALEKRAKTIAEKGDH